MKNNNNFFTTTDALTINLTVVYLPVNVYFCSILYHLFIYKLGM